MNIIKNLFSVIGLIIVGAIGFAIGGPIGGAIRVIFTFITIWINGAIVGGIVGAIIGAIRGNIALGIQGGIQGGGGCGCVAAIIGSIATVIVTTIGVKNVDTGTILIVSGIIGGIVGAIGATEDITTRAKAKTKDKRAIPPLHTFNVSIHNYEHLPKLEAPEGYVYVIQDVGHTRQCQFGYTNHPAASLYLFNGFLETRVVAILKTNNAPALEQELHEHYADQRTRGEWFELTDRQIQEIRSI